MFYLAGKRVLTPLAIKWGCDQLLKLSRAIRLKYEPLNCNNEEGAWSYAINRATRAIRRRYESFWKTKGKAISQKEKLKPHCKFQLAANFNHLSKCLDRPAIKLCFSSNGTMMLQTARLWRTITWCQILAHNFGNLCIQEHQWIFIIFSTEALLMSLSLGN